MLSNIFKGEKNMWTIPELKEKGRAAFHANYWPCVLVGLIFTFVAASGGGGGGGNSSSTASSLASGNSGASSEEQLVAASIILIIALIALAISLLSIVIKIFVFNNLKIGCCKFFVENQKGNGKIGMVFNDFGKGYWNKLWVMLATDFIITVASLALIVPGIIVGLGFRMIPYLMAENPNMKLGDAIRTSWEMMDGNKWHTFVLGLSFILWNLGGLLTLGLGNIFYVVPFTQATFAELFIALSPDHDGLSNQIPEEYVSI